MQQDQQAKPSKPSQVESLRPLSRIKKIAIFFVVIAAGLLAEREFSIWLGKQAVAKNNLPALSLEQALILSQRDGKPLLVNFSAYWCGYCRAFEKGTLANPRVQESIQQSFHYLRLEYTNKADKRWFNHYQIYSFPSLLILDSNGKQIATARAEQQAQAFLAEINRQTINSLNH